jgi:hypothetical protein
LIRPGTISRSRAFAWEVASDRDDIAAFDENVGERWFMNIAVVIVDLSASDQKPLGIARHSRPHSQASLLSDGHAMNLKD